MAVDLMAFAQGSATHPVRTLRRMVQALAGGPMQASPGAVSPTTYGGAHGVVGDGLAVSFVSGTTVRVAPGSCLVTGSLLGQGAYTWGTDVNVDKVAAAHHATLPRIDVVAVRVRDTDEDSSGAEDAGIEIVTGAAAATPSVPALAANASWLVLAEVRWPAASGAPTITDRRPFAAAIGGVLRCRSTSRPTGPARWSGVRIFEIDTGRELVWDGTQWLPLASSRTSMQQVTFDLSNVTNPSPGSSFAADVVLPFTAVPFTGVSLVTATMYAGFSSNSGTIGVSIYSNNLASPTGAGWSVPGRTISNSPGIWDEMGSMSVIFPTAGGGVPNATARIIFTNPNCYLRGKATLLHLPIGFV